MHPHKVPTHMSMTDKIVFGLTARQLLIVLIGCAVSYDVWLHLHMLSAYGSTGMIARIVPSLVPAALALVLALVNVADRPLEQWLFVWLRYQLQPKTYVWRSIRRITRAAELAHGPEELQNSLHLPMHTALEKE